MKQRAAQKREKQHQVEEHFFDEDKQRERRNTQFFLLGIGTLAASYLAWVSSRSGKK
jgi:hypothetical protein